VDWHYPAIASNSPDGPGLAECSFKTHFRDRNLLHKLYYCFVFSSHFFFVNPIPCHFATSRQHYPLGHAPDDPIRAAPSGAEASALTTSSHWVKLDVGAVAQVWRLALDSLSCFLQIPSLGKAFSSLPFRSSLLPLPGWLIVVLLG
jgi:hypothetical protein